MINLKLLKTIRFFHLINKKNYNEKRQIEIVKNSPLFDAKWYLAQNTDVKNQKIGAAKHYVKYGWKEGRNPSLDFNTEEYLAEYPELRVKNWCPLFHYMLEHKELMPKIDYKEQIFNLLDKYINRYKGKSADYHLIAKSKYFNKNWYLKTYPDVKKAKIDPIEHYMKHGWKEGRNPSLRFSTNEYLELNNDVKQAKINPLLHYLKSGHNEGRIISAVNTANVYFLSSNYKKDCIELSFASKAKSLIIEIDKKKFLPTSAASQEEKVYAQFLAQENLYLYIFKLPLSSTKYTLSTQNSKISISFYNFHNFRSQYFIIRNNKIIRLSKLVYLLYSLISINFSLKQKYLSIIHLFASKKYILFQESLNNANDNAYTLFEHYLKRYSNVYYITSPETYAQTTKSKVKKHMLIKNSKEHLKYFIRAKAVVCSYYFFNLVDTKLSQLIFPFLKARLIFIPHGISCDKNSYYLNYRNIGMPDKVYCCSEYEKQYFQTICGFKNVEVLGYPRMDKWFRQSTNLDKIAIFFTYRNTYGDEFFSRLNDLCQYLSDNMPLKSIYYLFHPSYDGKSRNNICNILKKYNNVHIVQAQDRETFNSVFGQASFLITDYSSVAYDFMYKEGKTAIFYKPIADIHPAYELLEIWHNINLCRIVNDKNELLSILNSSPTDNPRRSKFFKYIDDNNTDRVSKSIINELEKFFPTIKSDYDLLSSSELFDKKWYLKNNPDVKKAKINPIKHYIAFGWKEKRNPSPLFDAQAYITQYPDIEKANVNPLLHYERSGRREGRKIFSVFDYGAKNHKKLLNIVSKNIKFSIIVASYNYENYIEKTLNSLLAQTYKNFEIIVVDDGSKDNSLKVIKKFIRNNNNVFLYQHHKGVNKGLAKTVKLGLSKASGEYICFCESDDYWSENHLEELYKLICKSSGAKIISNDVCLIDNVTPEMLHHMNVIKLLLRKTVNNLCFLSLPYNLIPTFSAVAVERNVLSACNFNSSIIPAWLDWWLWRQILSQYPLYYIPKKLTFFRIHSSYNSNDKQEKYNLKKNKFLEENNKIILNNIKPQVLLKMYQQRKQQYSFPLFAKVKVSGLFSEKQYLRNYPESLFYDNALRHYVEIGWKKGYNPSDKFNTSKYLNKHLDVQKAGVNPLTHYVYSGKREGRAIFPDVPVRKIYQPLLPTSGKETILLGTHILNYTGAPMLLLSIADVLMKAGYNIILLSPTDGELRKEFIKKGATVIIDGNAFIDENAYVEYRKMGVSFCIFNTHLSHLIYKFFAPHIPSILWIHENLLPEQFYPSLVEVLKSFKDVYETKKSI